jgi:hypothetical protein
MAVRNALWRTGQTTTGYRLPTLRVELDPRETAEAVGVGLGGLDTLLKVRAGLATVLMRGGRSAVPVGTWGGAGGETQR